MPGISGIDTLNRLRAIKPDLPVLMMSGLHEPVASALPAQKQLSFLAKPFNRPELELALQYLLQA